MIHLSTSLLVAFVNCAQPVSSLRIKPNKPTLAEPTLARTSHVTKATSLPKNGASSGTIVPITGSNDESSPSFSAPVELIEPENIVEEKFGEQNFRVLSEMRFLGKIRVAILDFGRVCRFFLAKFGAKSDFRV